MAAGNVPKIVSPILIDRQRRWSSVKQPTVLMFQFVSKIEMVWLSNAMHISPALPIGTHTQTHVVGQYPNTECTTNFVYLSICAALSIDKAARGNSDLLCGCGNWYNSYNILYMVHMFDGRRDV